MPSVTPASPLSPGTPSSLSRRNALRLLAGTALAVPAVGFWSTPAFADDEFDTLRLRWRDLVLGTGFDAAATPYAGKLATLGTRARTYQSAMSAVGGSLWPEYPLGSVSANISNSYGRLNIMAQAWAQPGTGSTGDASLLADILTGLDHLQSQVYNASATQYNNWWDWQIGTPRPLLNICSIVYDHLGATRIADAIAAVDKHVPDSRVATYAGTSTGANRVDLCRVIALRGVIGKSSAKITTARNALSPVFPYVTSGDGLHADGSFLQHTYVAYTGTYGKDLMDGLGRLFALLAGSTWAVTDADRQIVLDAVDKSFAPFLYNGLLMDSVSGRGISRGVSASDATALKHDDHTRGQQLMAALALVAQGGTDTEKTRWHGLLKGWIARDTVNPVLSSAVLGIGDLSRLKTISDSPVNAAAEATGHLLFPAMDRAVHRRPGWAANVSMASNRITHYENGNGENLRGWHTGSGMLYWWGSDYANGQYSDNFWPTVDAYRLPGTTASRKTLSDGEGGIWGAARPDVRWVGGTTDGTYAAVGQYLKGLSSTLVAKKSWFFLDDTVICLGAGIYGRDGTGIETVVDNRNLGASGTHTLTVDGTVQSKTLGWRSTLTGAKWAHLSGHGGYVFPAGGTLKALREARTGTWSDINTGGTTDAITRRYLTLWFDHGTDPTYTDYAYLLMPGATTTQTSARAADTGWMTVLANTDSQQGLTVPSLGFTGVNFWFAGTVGTLTASAPASIMVKVTGSTTKVCVSGPLRNGAAIDVTWNRAVSAITAKTSGVEVLGTGSSLKLRITPGTAGGTHTAVVTLG